MYKRQQVYTREWSCPTSIHKRVVMSHKYTQSCLAQYRLLSSSSKVYTCSCQQCSCLTFSDVTAALVLGLINVTAAVCMMLTVRIFIDSCLIAFVTTSWCRGSALSRSHIHTPLFSLCCVSASSRYMRSAPQSFTCSHATVPFVLCVSQVSQVSLH